MEIITPEELPETIALWLWDNYPSADGMNIVEEAPGVALLRIEDHWSDDEDAFDLTTEKYLYIETDGIAFLAQVVERKGHARTTPSIADIRAAVADKRMEERLNDSWYSRELEDLRHFKQSAVSAAWLGGVVLLVLLIVRGCG